jgi:hypothetical protein
LLLAPLTQVIVFITGGTDVVVVVVGIAKLGEA